ncbi:MAG: biotin--[acetyl-CoA-carboxylase] ligase [Rhodospirillales bacterium]|nr:biotin--[acetyl-CoA-carboxylase] ligase [Rhodospirillales bacterium]
MSGTVRLPSPFQLVSLDSVDSTNEEAKRRAEQGAADGTVVWSLSQSEGRGRRGATWVSEPGNLYCSILLRPHYPAPEAMRISYVAAVAIADALSAILPKSTYVTCKWPNDILIDGRKAAGILMESSSTGSGKLDWLVVGMGVNISHYPENTDFPATSLTREGVERVTPEDMLETLCNRFQCWLVTWRNLGFAPVRRAWLERAHGLGEAVTVRLPQETLEGLFETLDADGALILRQNDGSRRIAAGEVYFQSQKN